MTERPRRAPLDSPTGTIENLEDVDWTFEASDTRYLTHGLHPYPARMIPMIPSTLLSYYEQQGTIQEGGWIYDPFSGSGTTAVEARLHGLNAAANDVNPFACMLTLAKSLPLEAATLDAARNALLDGLAAELDEISRQHESGEALDVEAPGIRDGWFPEPQLYLLCHVRDRIAALGDEFGESVVRFFRIALSSTTRTISYQRNGEYKRYRMPESERPGHDPDVLDVFEAESSDDIERMGRYADEVDSDLETVVHHADSRVAADVADDSADIVITSPPYGDHDTTVAYGQFSQDPAILTGQYGYDEMKRVDKTGLGGSDRRGERIDQLERRSPAIEATVDTLRASDGRAGDALDFFSDYFEVMRQVARVLKPGQPVAWVVANRTMSRVTIPTHLITRELCEHLGYEHETTLPREIPTKTLPWENAPENVPGLTGDLMAEEHIVVMASPRE